jgi:hypothetical protein
VDRLLPGLREDTAGLQAELSVPPPRGDPALDGAGGPQLRPVALERRRTHRAERRTLPLTLALLLFAFGSVAAAS